MSVAALELVPDLALLPVRDFEPPYEDDGSAATAPGTPLPLPLGRLRLVPPLPEAPRRTAVLDDDAFFGPQRTSTADLPDLRGWARGLVQGTVEALAGRRPASQVERFFAAPIAADIARRATSRRRTAPAVSPAAAAGAPAQVRSVHVCDVDDGVAEVTVVLRRGARTTAAALRFEGLDGRWLCTALQM